MGKPHVFVVPERLREQWVKPKYLLFVNLQESSQ